MSHLVKGFAKQRLFGKIMRNMQVDKPKLPEPTDLAFAITHFNSPEFLELNLKQLNRFHPESTILIFDNYSEQEALEKTKKLAIKHNAFLYINKRDYSNKWMCHIVALQYLLNEAAEKGYKTLAFLDQDCILTRSINDLASRLDRETLLIGARDQVVKTTPIGLPEHKLMRVWPDYIHASFMILQPKRIQNLFGPRALMNGYTFEPYHGISIRANRKGKILYLEMQMMKLPMLTQYNLEGKPYALHSWYSSRLNNYNGKVLNYLSVDWIKKCVKANYEFMEKATRAIP